MFIFLTMGACNTEHANRETVLDHVSDVKERMHNHIDSLPMLCDGLHVKKQFVDVGDCKLYCETEGTGISMIVINGGPGGTHHCFHPWFSEAAKYCQVIYYDQRGCGQSDFNPGEEGYTFEQAVDDLDRLREKLGIEKWIVCGYSYGGAIAQFYALTHPENVAGMVLIGALPLIKDNRLHGSREHEYISEEEKTRIKEIYSLYHNHQINLKQLLYNKGINGDWKRQHYYKPTNDEFIRQASYEWINDNGFNSSVSESLRKYDLKEAFHGCPIPTLLCEGKWDLTWKEEKKEIMRKQLPNARYVFFEHAGHGIFYDEPELFFTTLKKFVQQLKPVTNHEMGEWKTQTDKILGAQQRLFQREAAFFEEVKTNGVEAAIEHYKAFKITNKDKKLFTENGMNSFGYFSYLKKKDYETAIKLFKLNALEYPDSWNVYDSLGEAYLVAGNNKKAKENFKKSLKLNPDNTNGRNALRKIELEE